MPTIEDLLAHSGWARRLALALCADSSAAEDVLQDTWRAALTHGPRHGDSPRGWLATVIRNFARQSRRSASARTAREQRVARAEALPAADDVLERAQIQERALRAVLELDEPYRRTVLLCFFDGLSAEEVAAREGCPSATVRGRAKRALEQLRGRLDRDFGQRHAWLAALAPLVRDLASPAPATAVAAGTSILGGTLVSKKLVVAAAVAAAVILVGWSGLQRISRPEPESSGGEADSAALALPPADVAASEPVAAGTPDASQRTSISAAPAAAPIEEPPLGWLDVLVVDAETTAPVPGALVQWAEGAPELEETSEEIWRVASGYVDAGDYFARRGQARHADEAGRLRLRRAADGLVVAARAEGRWACALAPASRPSPLVLALEPDRAVEVQVLDEGGRPVIGARIGIHQRIHDEGAVGPSWVAYRSLVTRAPDGIATLEHAQHALRATMFDATARVLGWTLLPPPASIEPAVELDGAALPTERIRFHLGPSGEVEFVLRGADGAPHEGPCSLSVIAKVERGVALLGTWDVVGPRHVVPGVALGRTLEVTAYFRAPDAHAAVVRPGPTAPGERAVIELSIPADDARYEARLVGPDGAPVAGARVQVVVVDQAGPDEAAGAKQSFPSARTDAQGRLRVRAPEAAFPQGVRTIAFALSDAQHGTTALGTVEVPAQPAPGATAIGDVALEASGAIVSGRVVDASGAPVAGASVEVRAVGVPGAPGANGGGHPRRWTMGLSDAQGRFALRGFVETERVELRAWAYGALPATPVEAAHGARDVVMTVQLGGEVAGTLVLGPGLRAGELEVLLTTPEAGEIHRDVPDVAGRFAFSAVAPGTYDLQVRSRTSLTALANVPGVDVAAGQRTDLGRVRLRASSETAVITVTDERGVPMYFGAYRVRAPDPGAWQAFEKGHFEVRLEDAPLVLDIVAMNMRPVLAEPVDGDRTIALRRAIQVGISAGASWEPLPKPYLLGATLEPIDREVDRELLRRCARNQSSVGADGELWLPVPWPGRFEVKWLVHAGHGFFTETFEPVELAAPCTIEVADGEAEQRFAFQLPRAAIEAAIARLRDR